MIKGVPKVILNPDSVLARISEYDIFRYYMNHCDWEINKPTISPFMRAGGYEKNPSFLISNRNGVLHFVDFGDTSKRGNCFVFVQTLFGINFDEALKKIDYDFGLGITSPGDDVRNYKRIVKEYDQPESIGKRYTFIQVITKKFSKEELDYWSQFHITPEELRENRIYSIDKVFLNRQRFPLGLDDMTFGYFYDGSWKIYRPLIANKKNKWIPNNVPITTMDGLDNIKDCHTAFITKSKKDYMVVKKIYPHVCAVQNEGLACFSVENIEHLRANSKYQTLSFDSDVPGMTNAQEVINLFGFNSLTVPFRYLSEGIKDWADLAKAHGMSEVEKVFKENNLI